jgi:putative two-component system response regulator
MNATVAMSGESTRMPSVLIIDDEEMNRALLSELVRAMGFYPITAADGEEGLCSLREQGADIILCDLAMPMMTGDEVLKAVRKDSAWSHLPFILISGVDEVGQVVRCIELGADEYLTKPFNPIILQARIHACLERKAQVDLEKEYKAKIEEYNHLLEDRVTDQVKEITAAQQATIFALSKLSESRDPETGEHLERMREYCRVVGEHLRHDHRFDGAITESYVGVLYAASPLHDVGKVGIPDHILLKPGRLEPDEFNAMKVHTTLGAVTLRAVLKEYPANQFVHTGIEIAESHHEKWDGSGYPRGLVGLEIPLSGRILAIGDVYDALTSKRCYKEAFSHEKSRDIIVGDSGRHFDPALVEAFLEVEDQFVDIRQRFIDAESPV